MCGPFETLPSSEHVYGLGVGTGIDLADASISISKFCESKIKINYQHALADRATKVYHDTEDVFVTQEEFRDSEGYDKCDGEEVRPGPGADYTACFKTMVGIIDGCETDRTIEKIGGRLAEGCSTWMALSVKHYQGDEPVHFEKD